MVDRSDPALVVEVERHFEVPPAVVFALIDNDEHFFVLRPDAVEHRDLVPEPGGGHSCTQVYDKRGRRIAQRSTCLEHIPGQRMVNEAQTESKPGNRQRSTMTFEPAGTGSVVRVRQELFTSHRLGRFARWAYTNGLQSSMNGFLDRVEALIGHQTGS